MRRQARISAGGVLVARTASALQVWLWLLVFIFQNEFRISRSVQPGYLDFDNLPDTNFTCEGKVIGGYYADLETSCQMFHVCTVGQQDEPMDIKFLCLNGTVFDQETRVCERVDEVDCTKSEKFYSLNLELYGSSTAPPIHKPDEVKTTPRSSESPYKESSEDIEPDHEAPKVPASIPPVSPNFNNSPKVTVKEVITEHKDFQPTAPSNTGFTEHTEPIEENEEEEEINSELDEYEDDYSRDPHTTTQGVISTTIENTSTTTQQYPSQPSPTQHSRPSLSVAAPTQHPLVPPNQSSGSPSPAVSTIDPSLLSPQEFTYQHRGPGSEAISFQRQGFRPADGVYITHAPPTHQFDHFSYESSRTAPRPLAARPTPYVGLQRPAPAPFRPTTLDPRDQLLRPGPTSQPSEKHETTIKNRNHPYLPPLPAQRPLPFDPYFYERKRSDDASADNESSLSARSVPPPPTEQTERPMKQKSPPRVIVTASASVSDSNGKRLNYTVGNVVSAVKPIVPINYDDYKESDLIFDPFFLDVPKLQKTRKVRGSKVITAHVATTGASKLESVIPSTTILYASTTTGSTPLSSTTRAKPTTTKTKPSTTWDPHDYVDDNYEPQAYIPPLPPLATLLLERSKNKKQEYRHHKNELKDEKSHFYQYRNLEESKPMLSPAQLPSSQKEASATGAAGPPLPAAAALKTRA